MTEEVERGMEDYMTEITQAFLDVIYDTASGQTQLGMDTPSMNLLMNLFIRAGRASGLPEDEVLVHWRCGCETGRQALEMEALMPQVQGVAR